MQVLTDINQNANEDFSLFSGMSMYENKINLYVDREIFSENPLCLKEIKKIDDILSLIIFIL